jgi:DNA-directed RNA polymerase specialized sigma24 family protein
MSFDEDRRAAAIRALPVLPRTMFLLHNFYDVEVAAMAEGIGTDATSIVACLAEARSAIFRHWPRLDGEQHAARASATTVAVLGERLRLDYRASLEAAFIECGYIGPVLWPATGNDVHDDENAAATFIVSQLHPSLRAAVARLQCEGVGTLDLWQSVRPWRRIMRDRLLQVASELRCSGWQTFETWLADRIAPERYYPDGVMSSSRLRRPLPGEMDSAEPGHWLPHWPDDAARQARFDTLPIVTQHVYGLFHVSGRNSHEIARRLSISRRSVRRRRDRSFYAVAGWTYPNLAWRVYLAVSGKRTLWAYRLRRIRAALRE